ncbi:MAG: thioredoxin domain-containing protein [Pseudomonadota bacterium]
MANRLADETSPYLQQHADNPVDWWPWSDDALAEAKRTGKPILLSVGYAACHWCHVMAHESFEDPTTAKVMNDLYVNIKVDREERPDIDQIYMAALHATGEQGGWPLTMFLTPDAEPFFGGTYFPPTGRYGRPAFTDVLRAVANAHKTKPEMVSDNVAALREHIAPREAPGDLPSNTVDLAAGHLLRLADPVHGGTNSAPKFPNAGFFDVLWRGFARSGDTAYRDAVVRAANRMSMGGIYDHLGGGYARYSVDERWLVPHFEKMLYDNAQLLSLLADVWCVTKDPLYKVRAQETVAWLNREMAIDGLFASALDADSEGEEGKFYVWSLAEIGSVLGSDAAAFASAYDVTSGGNWEGTNVLNRLHRAGLGDDEAELAAMRARLWDVREERPRPARDDKLLADWNALAIGALAKAGVAFGEPSWLAQAERAYATAKETFSRGERLVHAVRGRSDGGQAFALDYAAMAHAALSLSAAGSAVPALLDDARGYVAIVMQHYRVDGGGYYWTAADGQALIARPSSPLDEAVPNANGVMVKVLAVLWAITGDNSFEDEARAVLRAHARTVAGNVFGTASLVGGLDLLNKVATVATRDNSLAEAARTAGHPAAVVLPVGASGTPDEALSLAANAAIVCSNSMCSLPIHDAEALIAEIWRQ